MKKTEKILLILGVLLAGAAAAGIYALSGNTTGSLLTRRPFN